jgi:hypothetical protein
MSANPLQHGVATAYAPSPILIPAPARVLPHLAQKCIGPCLQVLPSPALLHPRASLPAARPLAACRTATTSWILRILAAQLPQMAQILSALKSTLQRFSAIYVRNASPGRTTSDRIFVPTQMSAHSSAAYAVKHSPVSTTESDTRGCTRARRSLCAAAT